MRPLTEDEMGLVACAIRHPGFWPKPEYLPEAERMRERGWLTASKAGGELGFWLTPEGEAALELNGGDPPSLN